MIQAFASDTDFSLSRLAEQLRIAAAHIRRLRNRIRRARLFERAVSLVRPTLELLAVVSFVAMILGWAAIASAGPADAAGCTARPGKHVSGHWWRYRVVDGRRCWYLGAPKRHHARMARRSPGKAAGVSSVAPPPKVVQPAPAHATPAAAPAPVQETASAPARIRVAAAFDAVPMLAHAVNSVESLPIHAFTPTKTTERRAPDRRTIGWIVLLVLISGAMAIALGMAGRRWVRRPMFPAVAPVDLGPIRAPWRTASSPFAVAS